MLVCQYVYLDLSSASLQYGFTIPGSLPVYLDDDLSNASLPKMIIKLSSASLQCAFTIVQVYLDDLSSDNNLPSKSLDMKSTIEGRGKECIVQI